MQYDNNAIKGITLKNTEHKIGKYADDAELFLDLCQKA